MKRLSVIAIALISTMSAFAYYGSYDSGMPGWFIFVGVLMIIWGILNIILFFKVWGMCNNVNTIMQILLDNLVKDEEEVVVNTKKIQEKPKGASTPQRKYKNDSIEQNLMMSFNEECVKLFKKCRTRDEFETKVDDIIVRYNKAGVMDFSTLKEGLWEQLKML